MMEKIVEPIEVPPSPVVEFQERRGPDQDWKKPPLPSPWRARLDKLTTAIADGMRNLSAGLAVTGAQATALATRLAHIGAKLVVEATRSEKERLAEAEANARDWQVGLGPVTEPLDEQILVVGRADDLLGAEEALRLHLRRDRGERGLFVGTRSQLPTFQNPIALATYRPGVSPPMRLSECHPAAWITFQIQNTSKEERTFACTLVGKAL